MRVDVRTDPAASGRWRCLLDGEDVSRVAVAADDEEGWVDVQLYDEAGAPVLDRLTANVSTIRTERRQGSVRLIRRGDEEAA